MAYKLMITDRAAELLDGALNYLVMHLKNQSAALHLLDSVESIYSRLEENPMQFPLCEDFLLKSRKYRKAAFPEMSYVLIYRIEEEEKAVYVLGIFNDRENYKNKL